jgi:YHS domain-containing protein
MHIKKKHIIFCFFALLLIIGLDSCKSTNPVNIGSDGLAIKGYDTVAYFTVGKPVKGSTQFSHDWNGAKWLFASKEHPDLFAASPEKYAPQYGGY